jgi:hypothetical protein
MSDASNVASSLRERFGGTTEERLGKAFSDLLENPLLTGAIGRAFDAREKAAQAQEVAMGALNLPSAADIERLTRRLRSVSHRLEGIEDGVERLDRALSPRAVEDRLSAIEGELKRLSERLDQPAETAPAAAKAPTGAAKARSGGGTAKPRKAAAKPRKAAKSRTGATRAASAAARPGASAKKPEGS